MTTDATIAKDATYQFLKRLRDKLNENLPSPGAIKTQVDAIWAKPNKENHEKLESKENLAFYSFAVPVIFEVAKSISKLTGAEIRKAFRCVYFQKFPEMSQSNLYRKSGHPFSKKLGMKPEKIYESWLKPYNNSFPANQAWPEASLTSPFPYKIIFEAKYFDGEGEALARNQLVTAIYETAFYRGLPTCDGWDYDFSCLVAFDVSSRAYLKTAWDSLPSKRLFWADANLFVLIVR